MRIIYDWLFPVLWLIFWAYWLISAARVNKVRKIESVPARIGYSVLFGLSFALMAGLPALSRGVLAWKLLPKSDLTFFTGAAITIVGLAFAVQARRHLGVYWSGRVAIKEGHRLIRTGPYRLVRHPIYTGLLVAVCGTALAIEEVRGLVAIPLLWISFIIKSRREERWLTAEFGEEYLQFKREVPALIPFLRLTRKQVTVGAMALLVILGVTAYLGREQIETIRVVMQIHEHHIFVPVRSENHAAAPGLLTELRFLKDMLELNNGIQARSRLYGPDLKPLVKLLAKRQADGRNVAWSLQIYREIRWLEYFTSDATATRARIADLKKSLESDVDQSFAEEQLPDGSWGAGYTVWFMKLYGTVNEALSVGKKAKYPLSFLDRINSPEQLTNYLHSLVINDFLKTGVVNRMEADESISILGRLILGDVKCDYPFHPQLKEAYLKFIDDWQNPGTGCWGTSFVGRDGTVWRMDDVGMTFHVVDLTAEKTKHLGRIARRVLELSIFDFPAGIRMSGHYENHLNWDAVVIFRQAWPTLDDETKAEARAEISRMLKWCLAESYQAEGSFRLSELDETFGDAMEFGSRFLCEAGFFGKKYRFWTDQEFPEAEPIRKQLLARIEAAGGDTAELKRARRNLIRAVEP